jgi:predicted NBD/HSP70 family sugar kinase
MQNQPVLGIDIGGSGIKGALVDLAAGDFAAPRVRIPTPAESTPKNVASVVAEIVAEFSDQMGDGPVCFTHPDDAWVAEQVFKRSRREAVEIWTGVQETPTRMATHTAR